jgi:tetratricopeptide (TPR) repeat protein
MAYDQMGRPADANRMFEQAVTLEPGNKLVVRNYLIFLGRYAERLRDKGDKKSAIDLCRRQLELEPDYAPGMIQLASLYFGSQKKKEAVELLDRVLAQDPTSAAKRLAVGNAYLKSRKFKEAEKYFKEAVKLEPRDVIYLGIGISYWEARQKRKALPYFHKAAETASVEMLLDIAIHMMEENMVLEATSFLDKAIKRDPTHPMPHLIKGISALQRLGPLALLGFPGAQDEAIKELTEAVRLMEGKPEFASVRAEIQDMLKSLKEGPSGLLDHFGPPPGFLFSDDEDDDDDDFFFGDDEDDGDHVPFFDFIPPPARGGNKRKRR